MIWPGRACLTRDISCASTVPLKAPLRINYRQQFKMLCSVHMLYTIMKYFSSVYPAENLHSSFSSTSSGIRPSENLLSYLYKLHCSSYFLPFLSFFSWDWDPPTHIQLQSQKHILGFPWQSGSKWLCAFTAGDPDSISGKEKRSLQAACVILNTNGIAFIMLFFISYFMQALKMVITW